MEEEKIRVEPSLESSYVLLEDTVLGPSPECHSEPQAKNLKRCSGRAHCYHAIAVLDSPLRLRSVRAVDRSSESFMSVALDTTKDEKTERLSHPPALGVLCWGFPPGPRQMGLRPLWEPPQGSYFHTNDIEASLRGLPKHSHTLRSPNPSGRRRI